MSDREDRDQHANAEGAATPDRRPRRILALVSTTTVSGPGRQLVALAKELGRHGVEVRILLLSRPGTSTAFAEFAAANGIACTVVADRGPLDPRVIREVHRHVAAWQPDIVQTHSYKQTAILYVLRKLGLATPWVAMFEGETNINAKDRLYTRIEHAMLPAADRIVVMSRLQRDRFARHPEKVRIVYNSVPDMTDTTDAAPGPALLRRARGSGPRPLVGVVGRLSTEKGVDVFIDSMALLAQRGVALTAAIVGDGPERQPLEERVRRADLSDRIVFCGQIGNMRAVYAALDLLVIPSRSEGLPSVLLEAMQQDVPVISTRVGAMIEIAADNPDALDIVPPENPAALADAVARALGKLEAPRSREARARLVSEFSTAARCRRMCEVYHEALVSAGRNLA